MSKQITEVDNRDSSESATAAMMMLYANLPTNNKSTATNPGNNPVNPSNPVDPTDPVTPPQANADPWDSAAVKTELMLLLDQIKGLLVHKDGKTDVTFKLQYAMYLMQQFGAQRVGEQSDVQGAMQNFNKQAADLMKYFEQGKDDKPYEYKADDPNTPINFNEKDQPNTIAFLNLLKKMEDDVNASPLFPPEMKGPNGTLTSQLDQLRHIVVYNTTSNDCGNYQHGLGSLWWQYLPHDKHPQGSPTCMDGMMRGLGQVTQTFTGQSAIAAGVTKTQVKMYQTESDNLNTYMQSMARWENQQISLQRTQ